MTRAETTVTETPRSGAPGASEALTPDARGAWRRYRGWLIPIIGLIVAALVAVLTFGSLNAVSNRPLDPTSPHPSGAKALYEVLGQQGVNTERANSLDELGAMLSENVETTVVVDDPANILEPEQLDELVAQQHGRVDRIVLLDPAGSGYELASEVASYEGQYSENAGSFPAGSSCPLGEQAPAISNEGGQEFAPRSGAVGCYPVRDGYAVVIGDTDGVEVVVLGATTNLTNERITNEANAAMALQLLGSREHLVWYTAGSDDALSDEPQFGDYVPPWLTPVIILLIGVGVACVIWRGRRFGPLVAERLPVTVPAAETIEGRARLYDHGDARLHALDSIRMGTLARLAKLLGLNSHDSAETVAVATAATAGVTREHALHVLLAGTPDTDAALVELANAAAELERRVRAATGRTDSTRSATKGHDNDE